MPLTLTVSEAAGYEPHEADEWYDGTVVDIEETDGQWGAGLKWIIHLDGETHDDGVPRETWAFCSQKLSKRSKLYGWAKALGWNPETDTLALEPYKGARVQVMFEIYDGYDGEGNSVEKEKVVKIRKGKGSAPKAPAKPKASEPDDAPF